MNYADKGARLSPCEKYRFELWRTWDASLPRVAYVGLNPSTADAVQDDPTIRRCAGFAMSHGYGGFIMLNLWALRSTDPDALRFHDVTNEEDVNRDTIVRVAGQVDRVVGCWGNHPMAKRRASQLWRYVPHWFCLGTTKDGHPRHPLYLKATSVFVPLSYPGAARKGKR